MSAVLTPLATLRAPLVRVANWPERLTACLSALQGRPFAWGQHDCCTNAFDAVLAMTGQDRMADVRGRYADARSAYSILRSEGGLADFTTRRLGASLRPTLAGRGDVVMFLQLGSEHPNAGATLGVCVGPHIVAPCAVGTGLVDRSFAVLAWRI